jgi:hypothetical protein
MHPYRVKELLWLVILVLFIAVAVSGCGSAPRAVERKPQYCHTSQTIVKKNNDTVNSETTVECTDDQIKRIAANRLGMAPNCGEFTYWMQIGGRDVQRKGISCQKTDGNWEVINASN